MSGVGYCRWRLRRLLGRMLFAGGALGKERVFLLHIYNRVRGWSNKFEADDIFFRASLIVLQEQVTIICSWTVTHSLLLFVVGCLSGAASLEAHHSLCILLCAVPVPPRRLMSYVPP